MSCGRKIGPFDCCSVVQGDCLVLLKQLPEHSSNHNLGHSNGAIGILTTANERGCENVFTRLVPFCKVWAFTGRKLFRE
jgi:hypothetical protein